MGVIDAVDVLFIIMAAFGFYFGFSFGLMKVVLAVVSLISGVLAAMAFTPMTTNIIIETFEVNSVFLPFISFLVTLLIVLMLARIITKLIEETVDNKRFDIISQVIGGLIMGFIFTLLYSVLVLFFGQARVIKLVFNQKYQITRTHINPKLVVPAVPLGLGNPDTIYLKIDEDHNTYRFAPDEEKAASLSIKFEPIQGNEYIGSIGSSVQDWDISPEDTVRVKSRGQLYLMVEDKMCSFCDSTFLITSINDTMYFECLDDYLAAKSATSLFYKYIEVIPQRGTQLMKGMAPFIEHFLDYMSVALERLDNGVQNNKNPINVYSGKDNKDVVQPVDEEEMPNFEPLEKDTLEFSLDTTNMPTIKPPVDTTSEQEELEEVDYEG
ncbi:MAG: CvpA family protein [Aureispira sp.]|nr:CvpA family protein [Aureispira sp.]